MFCGGFWIWNNSSPKLASPKRDAFVVTPQRTSRDACASTQPEPEELNGAGEVRVVGNPVTKAPPAPQKVPSHPKPASPKRPAPVVTPERTSIDAFASAQTDPEELNGAGEVRVVVNPATVAGLPNRTPTKSSSTAPAPKPKPVVAPAPKRAHAPRKVPSRPEPASPKRPAPFVTPEKTSRDTFASTQPEPEELNGAGEVRVVGNPATVAGLPNRTPKKSRSPCHTPRSPARSIDSMGSEPSIDHLPRSPWRPASLEKEEKEDPAFCENPFIAKLHPTCGRCQVCIFRLSDREKAMFDKNGRHLRVNQANGGCEDCQVFPSMEGEDAVRICRQCFSDTHKLAPRQEEAFGGSLGLAGANSKAFAGAKSKTFTGANSPRY
jgi:hypothetical protein